MTAEETVQRELSAQFPGCFGTLRIQRARRLWAEVPADQFDAVVQHLHANMGFVMLCAITGLDEGATFGLLYHFGRPDGLVLGLKVAIPRARPQWHSLTALFPGAELYERELADLLGVTCAGLPAGLRYPLPDDWPENEFPLRKDWKPGPAGAPAAPGGEVPP